MDGKLMQTSRVGMTYMGAVSVHASDQGLLRDRTRCLPPGALVAMSRRSGAGQSRQEELIAAAQKRPDRSALQTGSP